MTEDEARAGLGPRQITIFNTISRSMHAQAPSVAFVNVRRLAIEIDHVLLAVGDLPPSRIQPGGTTPAAIFLVMSDRVAEPIAVRSTRQGAHAAIRELVQSSRWEQFRIVEQEVPS